MQVLGDESALHAKSPVEAAWRHRYAIAIVSLLAALTGYGLSLLQPVTYVATAQLALTDPRNAGVLRDATRAVTDPSRFIRNQARVATSTPVLIEAARTLGSGVSLEELRARVRAEAALDLDLVTITAQAGTAKAATDLANAVGEGYQRVVARNVRANADAAVAELAETKSQLESRIAASEEQLSEDPDSAAVQADRDAAVDQLAAIDARANQIAVDAALYGSGVDLFERAEPPREPAEPQPMRNAFVALLLGAASATAVSWYAGGKAKKVTRSHEPSAILGAPLLGEIPDLRTVGITDAVPVVSAPRSAAAEAFRLIAEAIDHALVDLGSKVILVGSALPGDGKTVTTFNLAAAIQLGGGMVTLVDADERMRGLSKLTALDEERGLGDVLRDGSDLQASIVDVRLTTLVSLRFLPAGRSSDDLEGVYRTSAFRQGLASLRESADWVILDSPPLLLVAGASAVAAQTDGIVLVVKNGTAIADLEDVRQRLNFVGAPLLGYVYNRAQPRRAGYGYGEYGSAPPPNVAQQVKRG